MKKVLSLILGILLIPKFVLAHCPLCTVGAGFLALGAAWLGINPMSIGVFIGAFSVALGFWIGRILPQKVPYQTWMLAVISFLTTILPLMALLPTYSSIYISWGGEYGSLLNRTYAANSFLLGSVLGSILLLTSPSISKAVRKVYKFPFQGIVITFFLLLVAALIIEIIA